MIPHHTALNRVTFCAKKDNAFFDTNKEMCILTDMDEALDLAYQTLLIGLMEKPEIVAGLCNSVLDSSRELGIVCQTNGD